MISGALDEQQDSRPQPRKKHKKRLWPLVFNNLVITVEMIEAYCLSRQTWEEAKPFVDFLEKAYGLFPPKRVKAAILKIGKHFNEMKPLQVIKAKTVVVKNSHFDAFNNITRNRTVKLDKDYEE